MHINILYDYGVRVKFDHCVGNTFKNVCVQLLVFSKMYTNVCVFQNISQLIEPDDLLLVYVGNAITSLWDS